MFVRNLIVSIILFVLSNELRAQAAPEDDGCGTKTIDLKAGKQIVEFPLNNVAFSTNTNCKIAIKSPDGYTTSTSIDKISIKGTAPDCNEGYFRVADVENNLNTAEKKCGAIAPAEILKAMGTFYLEINMNGMQTASTFSLAFTSNGPNDGCGTKALRLNPGTQTVKFPLDDQAFSAQTNCQITVTPPEGYTSSTSIESISIQDTNKNCNQGYFQVADTVGGLQKANKYCGNQAVADILKASGPFYIQIIILDVKTVPTFTLKFVSSGPNDGCGNKALQLSAETESVNFPLNDQPFSDKTNCIITVTPPKGLTTSTSIESIAIQDPNSNCDQGYFQVAATSEGLSSATKRCGTKAMADILQASDPFYVQIVMAGMKSAPTFTLKFVSGVSRILASSILTTICIIIQNLKFH